MPWGKWWWTITFMGLRYPNLKQTPWKLCFFSFTKVSLSKRPGFLITIHFKHSMSSNVLEVCSKYWSSAENVHNFYIWYTVFLDFSMKCICSWLFMYLCHMYIIIIYMCVYWWCIDNNKNMKIVAHIWYIYRIPCRTCRFNNNQMKPQQFGKDQHGESVLNFRSGPFVGRRGTLC